MQKDLVGIVLDPVFSPSNGFAVMIGCRGDDGCKVYWITLHQLKAANLPAYRGTGLLYDPVSNTVSQTDRNTEEENKEIKKWAADRIGIVFNGYSQHGL